MTRHVVLISCVSQKLPHRAKAEDLYISTLFRLNLKYARLLNPDSIYILSAKYGLLELDQEVDPYEQTLNDMGTREIRAWADRVLEQLRSRCPIDETEFTFLAGDRYRAYLIPHLRRYRVPLEGLRIGEQLQRLKQLTA